MRIWGIYWIWFIGIWGGGGNLFGVCLFITQECALFGVPLVLSKELSNVQQEYLTFMLF